MFKSHFRSLSALGLSLAFSLSACQAGGGPGNTSPRPSPTTAPSVMPSAEPSDAPTPSPQPSDAPTTSPVPTLAPTSPPSAGGSSFASTLSGAQESPPVNTSALGTAKLTLNAARTEARIEVATSGLSGPITGAHIHAGAAGQNGAVVKPLTVNGNVISAVWRSNDSTNPLSSQLVDSLINGQLYVNVHTAAHPNGEIRGQLNSSNDTLYTVYLSSGQEVPAVPADSTGAVLIRVRPDGNSLMLEGTGHDLTGEITGAHIHQGAVGANGPVVKELTVNHNQLSLNWSRTDAESPLTDELLSALQAGDLYVNVHTSHYPDGEIRGQILAGAPTGLSTHYTLSGSLTGANEVPAVETDAYGTAAVRLHAENRELTLQAQVAGLSGAITGAHIHQGAAGINGPVVKELSVNGNQLSVTWRANDGDSPLTVGLLNALLAGELYINVHTAANPGGEIRSQLTSTRNRLFAIELTGNQEVPAVNTSARGAAWVMLSPDHKEVTLMGSALGLSGDITAAHIHAAPVGLSGPVIKDLSVDGKMFSATWRNTDSAQPLTYARVRQLLNGELYINVHTAANPNGEVRGQIR